MDRAKENLMCEENSKIMNKRSEFQGYQNYQ